MGFDGSTIGGCLDLAHSAHFGQDRAVGAEKEPYISHPVRVMAACLTDEERMTALLHDVIEDTAWTADELRAVGVPEPVVKAVLVLTKPDDGYDGYDEFIQRVADSGNRTAVRVKLLDLQDNMNSFPGTQWEHLLPRYARAQAILMEAVDQA